MINQGNQAQINLNLNDADDMKCPKCENLFFKPLLRIKKVSALLSPTGQETIVPVQILACSDCNAIINDLKDLNNLKKKKKK
jgi:hypothetical protein